MTEEANAPKSRGRRGRPRGQRAPAQAQQQTFRRVLVKVTFRAGRPQDFDCDGSYVSGGTLVVEMSPGHRFTFPLDEIRTVETIERWPAAQVVQVQQPQPFIPNQPQSFASFQAVPAQAQGHYAPPAIQGQPQGPAEFTPRSGAFRPMTGPVAQPQPQEQPLRTGIVSTPTYSGPVTEVFNENGQREVVPVGYIDGGEQ